MTELDKDAFKVKYDAEIQAVVMEWKGYFTSDEFKKGTEQMLELLKDNKAKKVLALTREMILIGMEDQKWLENSFIPRATELGFKACAIMLPENYFNRVAIETIIERIGRQKISVKLFEEEKDARAWLKSLEAKILA